LDWCCIGFTPFSLLLVITLILQNWNCHLSFKQFESSIRSPERSDNCAPSQNLLASYNTTQGVPSTVYAWFVHHYAAVAPIEPRRSDKRGILSDPLLDIYFEPSLVGRPDNNGIVLDGEMPPHRSHVIFEYLVGFMLTSLLKPLERSFSRSKRTHSMRPFWTLRCLLT
jgi:hypothetical protein